MSDENYLERIEQLRHDRDKYIGMWRSQCNIAEEVMKERDRYKAALAEVMEEYGHKCAKCGSVLQLVRPGKHQCQYCEMESALTAELARYKQGVEVEGYVIGVPSDIDANLYFASGWSRELGKLRGKVRVLVMKVEG